MDSSPSLPTWFRVPGIHCRRAARDRWCRNGRIRRGRRRGDRGQCRSDRSRDLARDPSDRLPCARPCDDFRDDPRRRSDAPDRGRGTRGLLRLSPGTAPGPGAGRECDRRVRDEPRAETFVRATTAEVVRRNPRPESYSFPSGHSMSAMAIYGTIATVLIVLRPRLRSIVISTAAFLIVAVDHRGHREPIASPSRDGSRSRRRSASCRATIGLENA